jgi:hypothetical protein
VQLLSSEPCRFGKKYVYSSCGLVAELCMGILLEFVTNVAKSSTR